MATDNVVIGGSSVTARQMSEFFRQIGDGTVNGRHVQAFLDHQNPWALTYGGLEGEELNQTKGWESFYWTQFGIRLDFSRIVIPKRTLAQRKEFTRLLAFPEGLTNNYVYNICVNNFPCWRYIGDLNKAVSANDRDPQNGAYAIWVRDAVEADEVHRDKSANTVKREGLKTETLLERMIHELKYFLETGKHLDISKKTLCNGSRDSDGDVPCAFWIVDEFRVEWFNTDVRGDILRSREVIS